jgi:hypothetical protein
LQNLHLKQELILSKDKAKRIFNDYGETGTKLWRKCTNFPAFGIL